MADETRAEREERISQELREQYQEEGQRVTNAGLEARENTQPEQGFQNWDEYNDHVSKVPGIFGDLDTTNLGADAGDLRAEEQVDVEPEEVEEEVVDPEVEVEPEVEEEVLGPVVVEEEVVVEEQNSENSEEEANGSEDEDNNVI